MRAAESESVHMGRSCGEPNVCDGLSFVRDENLERFLFLFRLGLFCFVVLFHRCYFIIIDLVSRDNG